MPGRLLKICGVLSLMLVYLGCNQKAEQPQLTILLRMMPAQERYLRQEVLPAFENEYKCKVRTVDFENQWDIDRMLKLEKDKDNPEIDIVKTPFEMTRVLADKGYMEPLKKVEDSAKIMMDLAEYHQLASGLGFINDTLFYLPRKLETRIFFYRKSKVKDAVDKYETYKNEIDNTLRKMNGGGLPEGYEFEEDPGEWDFYDLFAAGYIWANEEYNNVKMGRIAHRGANYGGTALFFVDRMLQMGATTEEIMKMKGEKVAETFLWENAFKKAGIYNPGIWQEKWKGADIYNAVKDGKIYCAYMQQIDCFNLHGWEEYPPMPGYLPEKDDMGLSMVPQAISFRLDNKGTPVFEGTRKISTGGWWWGIPKTSKNKKLAYSFMRYITSKDVHAKESTTFGMIPVRKDILRNVPQVFEQGWVGSIYKTSVSQMENNKLTTIPLNDMYQQVSRMYVSAWNDISVEEKNPVMKNETIKRILKSDYEPAKKK